MRAPAHPLCGNPTNITVLGAFYLLLVNSCTSRSAPPFCESNAGGAWPMLRGLGTCIVRHDLGPFTRNPPPPS